MESPQHPPSSSHHPLGLLNSSLISFPQTQSTLGMVTQVEFRRRSRIVVHRSCCCYRPYRIYSVDNSRAVFELPACRRRLLLRTLRQRTTGSRIGRPLFNIISFAPSNSRLEILTLPQISTHALTFNPSSSLIK